MVKTYQKLCPHCLPAKGSFHGFQRAISFLRPVHTFLAMISMPLKKFRRPVEQMFLRALYSAGMIRVRKDRRLSGRSGFFSKEAKRRGMKIFPASFLGMNRNDCVLFYGNRKYIYDTIPFSIFDDPHFSIDDKALSRKKLEEIDLPTAKGRSFTSKKKALEYAKTIGFPLVVKPRFGSLSKHVTVNINDEDDLVRAIDIAREYDGHFIVERYLPGSLYRATVIGKDKVYFSKKEKPNVLGDGLSSLRELIIRKNESERRAPLSEASATIHEIALDERLSSNLLSKGFTLDSVLKKGEILHVKDKYTLAEGCDIEGCTKSAHTETVEICRKIAHALSADIVGIDIIAEDIKKPWRIQKFGIIETNSLPYLDMHHNPTSGKADPIARDVAEFTRKKLDSLRW